MLASVISQPVRVMTIHPPKNTQESSFSFSLGGASEDKMLQMGTCHPSVLTDPLPCVAGSVIIEYNFLEHC